MARLKINEGNKNVSISLPLSQHRFIKTHPLFNLSKFVQSELDEFISHSIALDKIEGVMNDNKTTTG